MTETVRDLLTEIAKLRQAAYERTRAAKESVETQETYLLRYLEALLELARHDAEQGASDG